MNHDHFMGLALERARSQVKAGGRPIYCLVVQEDGRVVGHAGNTVARDWDPTPHAEVNAIPNACAALKTVDLTGCTLYTPMEPCPMCFSTILEAKISRIVLGARHRRAGRTDLGAYSVESLLQMMGRELEIVLGIYEAECEELRLAWKRLSGEP